MADEADLLTQDTLPVWHLLQGPEQLNGDHPLRDTKMGAFATDQTVVEQDLRTLRAAVQGQRQALVSICQRYEIPVVAVAIQTSGDLERAYACVGQVLEALCRQLLASRFSPEQWASQLTTCVIEYFPVGDAGIVGAETSERSILSGLESIPRIARRRAVSATLPKLPLPELTAILLRYVQRQSASQMVGLVADSEQEVCQRLAAAHELLQQEVRTRRSTS
jgi:hypothetical protein